MPISISRHGAPFLVQHDNCIRSGASQSSSLSKTICHSSNSYDKINFVSCHGANGGYFSNAQMLANTSGRPVTGYYGRVNKLTANLAFTGRTFYPQDKTIARICSAGNRILSGPVKVLVYLRGLLTQDADDNLW
ncbi:effector protein [Salmonella enterica subsp. enterica]|nr:effector protein [Salmonella enterica]EAC2143699.1 effector protein [Salmonella enterica subsp. enterica]EDW0652524.1 effector protein [Salmonella enterica subsp. enterica serovar Weslaco]EDX3113544.1 effector protein [Salmonella enterica subsp. enterica serovar Mississippi]EAQ8939969.1 effector protein [Salmonella enterica]